MVCWKVVSMAQNRHSKPLTLGAAYSACLCGEDALLDGGPTQCSRCTCLYTVASSRGTHNVVNRFVWAIMFAPTIWRACVALPTLMRFGRSVLWARSCSCGCFTRLTPLRSLHVSLFLLNALFAWTGVDTPGVARLLYVLLHRRSFSSTHRYHKKHWHATIPGRSRNGYKCTGTPYKRLRRKL